MRLFSYLALVAALTTGAWACNTDRVDEPGAPESAGVTTAARDDGAIRTELQAKYYADNETRGQGIDVSADGGVVTLRGTVDDADSKKRAVDVAEDVEGVTRVNDMIEVRQPPATQAPAASRDERDGLDAAFPSTVTARIQAKYFLDPDVKPWSIDVTTTSSGVVTLEGTVSSEQSKAEAERIARDTEGVTRVDNKLRIDADRARRDTDQPRTSADTSDMNDTWLTTRVQAKYFLDGDVRGRNIDVTTSGGVVTLTGMVGNEAERRQALALARSTDGVREVVDKLTVGDTANDPAPRARTVTRVERPDPWITMKIQARYFLDNEVKGHEIDVDTNKGVVTLKGSVETAQQKQEAELIARETEGVTRVINQLTVGA